jgi:hypothetical protein
VSEDAELATLRVDGGMVVNDWLCQFLADTLDRPVERPVVVETTALGAAYLAGLAAGIYSSLEAVAQAWRLDRRFEPAMAADDRRRLLDGWRQAVARVRGWGLLQAGDRAGSAAWFRKAHASAIERGDDFQATLALDGLHLALDPDDPERDAIAAKRDAMTARLGIERTPPVPTGS